MRLLLTCAAFLAPLPTFAQTTCPTGETFRDTPIIFTVDGEDEVHRRSPNGVITIDSAEEDDGVGLRAVMAHGIHVLQLADRIDGKVDANSVWRFLFPVAVADLPAPVAGKTWSTQVTTFIDGEVGQEQVSHVWGQESTYTVGSCTFRSIPVRASYRADDYSHTEDMMYFPDLGTAIFLTFIDSEWTDNYTYTAVRSQ